MTTRSAASARRRRAARRPARCARGLCRGGSDALLLVERADEGAELGPSTRSSGTASGATTCTSSPRARSDAAASSPMKLPPMTTARFACFAAAMMRAAVGERAQVVHSVPCRRRGAFRCTGSAPVASRSASNGSASRPSNSRPARRQRRCACARARTSSMRCSLVESGRPERDPLLGCVAGEIVLGEVRAVVRRVHVVVDHRDAPVEPSRRSISAAAFPAAPRADDHDVVRRRGSSALHRIGRRERIPLQLLA